MTPRSRFPARIRPALFAAGVVLAAGCGWLQAVEADATPAARLTAEIARLRAAHAATRFPDALQKQAASSLASLDPIEKSLRQGDVHLALRDFLGQATVLEAVILSQDADDFETSWKAFEGGVEEAERILASEGLRSAPLAVRALAQVALTQVGAYRHSARAFADIGDDLGGRFYLGQARAYLGFGRVCAALRRAKERSEPPLPPLGGERARMDSAVRGLYSDPERAIEKHRNFIALNATLKSWKELEERDLRPGTLYTMLDAKLRSGVLQGRAGESREDLREELVRLQADLSRDPRDHGIGRIFLEMAARELDASGEPDLDLAGAALLGVLPEYLRLVGGEAAAATGPGEAPAMAEVVVTLVRWPYT